MRKRRRAIALGAIALTLIAAILGHEAHLLLANVRTLDPATCTGDWEGARSLAEEDEEGRAIASEGGQKIFCTFPSPTDTPVPLTRAVVSFTFEDYRETDPAPEEAATEEPESEAEGTTEEESDAGTGTDEEAPAPEVLGETSPEEGDEEQAQEPAPEEPAPEPDAEPAPVEAESVPAQESEASPEDDAPEDASEAGGDAPSEASARAFPRLSWLSFARVAHAQSEPASEEPSAEEVGGEEEEEAADAPADEAEPPSSPEAGEEPPLEEQTPDEMGTTDESSAEEPPAEELPAENEAAPEESEDEEVPAEEEEGEVLGDSTEPGEDDEAPVLTLSYTTTGARWTDLTTFSPLGNEVTFDIDLDSTADLEKLVVRLTADEIRGEPIVLTGVEVRIYTEAPLDELAALLVPGEFEGFPHLYTKEFVIDPKARHACVIEPSLINAGQSPSIAFVARLYEDKDDLKAEEAGSGEEVAEQPAGEADPLAAAPEDAAEELPPSEETPIEDAPPEDMTTEAGADALPEETPLSEEAPASPEPLPAEPSQDDAAADEQPESPEEPAGAEGLLAGAITASEAVIDAVGDAVADLAEGGLGGPAALLEMGSLPRGIDIRFLETSGYALEFEDRVPAEVPLTLSIADPALAQRGSFSIPLIFTMRDGKDSITVCQMQVRNLPSHE